MILTEINPSGQFGAWDSSRIEELKNVTTTTPLGNVLLFENENIRLWNISLNPGERLPFRVQEANYNWICINGGLAISRFEDGKICLVKFEVGDVHYWEFTKDKLVCDLENIGGTKLTINIIEYKISIKATSIHKHL